MALYKGGDKTVNFLADDTIFIDAGADTKITSGDYIDLDALKALATGGAGTYSLVWVNGDTTQSVATFTVA